LLRKLLAKFKNFFYTVRKDIIYIVLMFFIIFVFGINYYHLQKGEAEKKTVIEEYKGEDLKDLLRSSDVSKGLKIVGFIIVFATVTGIIMIFNTVYRLFFMRKPKLLPPIDQIERSDNYGEERKPSQLVTVGGKPHEIHYFWNLWDVAKVIIVFFTSYIFLNFLQEIVITVFKIPEKNINASFLLILDMLFAEVIAIFFLLKTVNVKYNHSISEFGLNTSNLLHHFYIGIKSYFMFLPFYFLLNYITLELSKALNIELKAQEVLYMLSDKSEFTEMQLKLVIIFVTVLGPIFEEIFFRGFLYRCLRNYFGVFWGILASALLFSLIHHNFMAFLPIITLGVVLGYLVEKTGSLVPSIVMHIIVNSISVAVLFSMPKS